jgi:quercetin dioxygenase-like cupin family protein
VIDGEIKVTLENEGSWRLGAGEAINHPADIRHRWAVVGDGRPGSCSVAHAHPAAGPVPLPAPDRQAGHSIH